MLNKKLISLLIAFICFASFITAEKIEAGSLKEPNDNRVVLVGKVSLKNPINLEARREAFNEMKAIKIGKTGEDTIYHIGENVRPENVPTFGETFFTIVKNKDGKYTIPYFTGTIFPDINPWFQFALPCNVTITIPEDAKYVYIGNFEYDLDYALRTVGFKHYDEYSAAQQELNAATGKKEKLYRAELTFK